MQMIVSIHINLQPFIFLINFYQNTRIFACQINILVILNKMLKGRIYCLHYKFYKLIYFTKMENILIKNQKEKTLSQQPINSKQQPDPAKIFGILFGYNRAAQQKPTLQQNVNDSYKDKLHEEIDNNCCLNTNRNSLNPGNEVNGSNLRSSVGNWSFRQQNNQSFKKGVSVYLNDSQFSQLNPNQEQNSKDNSYALSKEIIQICERHSQQNSRIQLNNEKNYNKINEKDQSLQELRQILLGSGLVGEGFQGNLNQENQNIHQQKQRKIYPIKLSQNQQLNELKQILLGSNLMGTQIQQAMKKNSSNKNFTQKMQTAINKNNNNMTSFIEQSKILSQKNYNNNNEKNFSQNKKNQSQQSDHFLQVDPNGLQNLLQKFDDLQDQHQQEYQISIIQPVQVNCLNNKQLNNIQISHFEQAYINQLPQLKNSSISVMKSSNQTKIKFYQSQKYLFNRKDSKQSKQKVKTQIRETNSQIMPIQQSKSHSPNKNDQISPLQFLTSIIQKSQKNYVVKINGINISQWGKQSKSQNQKQDKQKKQNNKKNQDCITIQVTKNEYNQGGRNAENYCDEITSNVKNQCQKRRASRKYSLQQKCLEQIHMFDSIHTKKMEKTSKKKKKQKKSGDMLQKKNQKQHQKPQVIVFKKTKERELNSKIQQKNENKQQEKSKIKFLIKKIKKLQKNIQLLTKLQQQDKTQAKQKVQIQHENFGNFKTSSVIKQKKITNYNFIQTSKPKRLSLDKGIVEVQIFNERKEQIKKNSQFKDQNSSENLIKVQNDKNESKILQQLVKMQQKIAYLEEKINSQNERQNSREQRSQRYQQINSSKYIQSNNSANKMYETYFEQEQQHRQSENQEDLSKQKSFKRSNGTPIYLSNYSDDKTSNKLQNFNKFQNKKNSDFNENILQESPNRSASKQPGRIIKKSDIQKCMTTNQDKNTNLNNNNNVHDAISLLKNKIYFNHKNDSQVQSEKSCKKNIGSEVWQKQRQSEQKKISKNNGNINIFQFDQLNGENLQFRDNFLFNNNSNQFQHHQNYYNNSKNFLQESKRLKTNEENMLQFNTQKQKYFIDSKQTENYEQLYNKSKSLSISGVLTFQKLCQKSLPIIPNLPLPPTPQMSQENLIQLGRCLFQLFQVDKINDDQIVLSVKKYKNCVYFGIDSQNNILWHYQGKIYFGGWKSYQNGQGQKFGEGLQYNPNKYLYSGQFNYGKRNGQGVLRMFQPSSSIYIGQFIQGLKHGRGRLVEQNGGIYQGQWKSGKKHGAGVLIISENQKYDGIFINGLKCGHGAQIFKNGDSYQGQYKNDKFEGKGFYQWHNGSSYEGQFKNGKRNGFGVWKSALKNADIYEGHYLNDLKQGFGIYKWPNGSSYQGAFKSDKKHGIGKTVYENGKISNLYWENGKVIKKLSDQQQQKWDNNFEQDFMKKNKKIQKKSIPKFQLKRQSIQKRTPSASLHNFNTFNNNNAAITSNSVQKKGRIPSGGSVKWLNRQKSSHQQQTRQHYEKQQPKIAYRCKSSSNIRRLPKGDQLKQAQYRGVQSTINIAKF